jgi:hypothetical protein
MQSGELSNFELYLYLCGGNMFDISQNLEFFLLKKRKILIELIVVDR